MSINWETPQDFFDKLNEEFHFVEMSKTWFITVSGASAGYGDKDTYGKVWLAYRRKPEED